MKFNVTLDFKKGTSFGASDVEAPTEQEAIERAKSFARSCGFDQKPTKAKAVPASSQ